MVDRAHTAVPPPKDLRLSDWRSAEQWARAAMHALFIVGALRRRRYFSWKTPTYTFPLLVRGSSLSRKSVLYILMQP